jgi:hypothetical protein
MSLPADFTALNLSSLPVDYSWDSTIFNTFWVTDYDANPRLADALWLIGVRPAFALGVACSEWVATRVAGHVETADALLRIEAAWAVTADRRYASLTEPPSSPPSAPWHFASPLTLAMRFLWQAAKVYHSDGVDVRTLTQGLALLAEHIAGRHPAFSPWLSESLRRAHQHFPQTDVGVEQEPAVPREFFYPGFVWRDGIAQESLDRFVQTLDPPRNPYLCSPDQMRAAGFPGLPYGRII